MVLEKGGGLNPTTLKSRKSIAPTPPPPPPPPPSPPCVLPHDMVLLLLELISMLHIHLDMHASCLMSFPLGNSEGTCGPKHWNILLKDNYFELHIAGFEVITLHGIFNITSDIYSFHDHWTFLYWVSRQEDFFFLYQIKHGCKFFGYLVHPGRPGVVH